MPDVPPENLPVAFRDAALAQLSALYRLAFHLSGDATTADDLVQETYLLAFRSAHTFQPRGGGIRPWLFKILHNAYRVRARFDSRLVFDDGFLDRAEDESALGLLAPNARVDDVNWEMVDESLKHAIDDLPESLRVVFLLFAVEDLRYRNIADVLEIPIGTVMSRLARARKLLIDSLAAKSSAAAMENGPARIVGEGTPLESTDH